LFVPVHAVPSGAAGLLHAPVVGSHVPATWQASLAVQVTALDPVQVPLAHANEVKQGLPPVQAVPSDAVGFEQAPVAGSHVPAAWH
jgi:hypothetical protein